MQATAREIVGAIVPRDDSSASEFAAVALSVAAAAVDFLAHLDSSPSDRRKPLAGVRLASGTSSSAKSISHQLVCTTTITNSN